MKNVEVEVQAFLKEPKKAEQKLRKVGKFIRTRKQVDVYFVPPQRDFFKKEPPVEYLRVREEQGRDHLNYSFLHFGKGGQLRATDEYETSVGYPATVREIFKKIGLIPKVTVRKTRTYFECGTFEVALDRIQELGDFIEVEAKKNLGDIDKTKKACFEFLDSLDIEYEARRQMGYPRMLYRKLQKARKL